MTGLWLVLAVIEGREQTRTPSVANSASFASYPHCLENMARSMNSRQRREDGSWEDQDGIRRSLWVCSSQFEPRGNSHALRKKEPKAAIICRTAIALGFGRRERDPSSHAKKKKSEWPWYEYEHDGGNVLSRASRDPWYSCSELRCSRRSRGLGAG